MHRVWLILGVLAIAAPAHADDLSDPYAAITLNLGLAGDADLHTDGIRIAGLSLAAGASADFAPQVSIGGGILYMHPIIDFFSLGGRFSVLSWRTDSEGSGSRNLAFDLAVVPQARLPLTAAIELYLSIPVGIAMNVLNEFDRTASLDFAGLNASASLDSDLGVGWNVAALVGARLALSRSFGLLAELGYGLHSVSHDVSFRAGIGGASGEAAADVDVRWSQIALDVGAYF